MTSRSRQPLSPAASRPAALASRFHDPDDPAWWLAAVACWFAAGVAVGYVLRLVRNMTDV